MGNPKVVKVLIAIPNMGYAHSEAYGNRLINFMHMGNLQTEQRVFHLLADFVEKENPELAKKMATEFLKNNSQYVHKNHEEVFQFFFVNIGRIFTPAAREEAAKWAVEGEMDYLFFVDDDMICPDDLFLKLYRHNAVADIVCPLAFTRNFPHKPVLYASVDGWDPINKKDYFINNTVMNYPKDSLVRADACGFGAALIKTWIFKELEKPWFMSSEGTGEDILFCAPDGIVYGDFNDISVPSEEAITHTGIKHKIDQFHHREYTGDLVNIKPLYTEPLRLTPNHPVLSGIIKKSERKQAWINAGDLTVRDFLFFPKPKMNDYVHRIDMVPYAFGADITDGGIKFSRTHKDSVSIPSSVEMDSELAWLFGFYVAEGNATKNNVCFSFNGYTEMHYAKRLKMIMKNKFNCVDPLISKRNGSAQLTFVSAVLSRFFRESFGIGAKNKKFPKWICDNKRFSGKILRGLWDGDGMIKFQTLSTISRVLSHQVKNLLAANSILSSIRTGSNEKRGYQRNYSIAILAQYRKKFGELIGVNLPDIKNMSRYNDAPFVKLNDIEGWRIPIEKISTEKYSGNVFNAGVNTINSYVLNGIAVHNCYKAKKVGAKVYMDTSTKLGHLGNPVNVTEEYVTQVRKDHDPLSDKRYAPYKKFESVTIIGDK